MRFPPKSQFPDVLDTDYSLYKVYNTAESFITADNQPWADEIDIFPKHRNDEDKWADNGFANLDGELLYYDAVEKNENDRVNKLKSCIRNLGGTKTHLVPRNTVIRSFVIAEHHNQIVDAIINIERYIGLIDCDQTDTLTCCLSELQASDCIDDSNCFDVDFDYTVESVDPCLGTIINYTISINGNFNNFRLDFGDGTFTTIVQDGTKRYPPGSKIDPFVIIGNDSCELLITGVERTEDQEPTRPVSQTDLTIPIPEISIPSPTFVTPSIEAPDMQFPPIITPCISMDPFNISIGDISINVPSVISIVPPIPSVITVIDSIPETITLIDSLHDISLIVPTIPNISVIWGTPPTISVTIACPSNCSITCNCSCTSQAPMAVNEPFSDQMGIESLQGMDALNVEYEFAGIPSKILLDIPSEFPRLKIDDSALSSIPIDWGSIPEIKLNTMNMPSLIEVKHDIPSTITIEGMIDTIQVLGFPEYIPLRLENPEDFIVRLEPAELKIKLDIDKLFSEGSSDSGPCFRLVQC